VVILFADDLGYGDLSSYGAPTIRTPNLDRMASEGIRLTSFYAQPVCTPSRAALLTGRYPIRSGMDRVLFPHDSIGLPLSEVTLAEALKARGYRTMAIGKWHLGRPSRFLPTHQGFDHYYGIPYSNDMDRGDSPPVPILRDTTVVEQPAEQSTLTKRYTGEALRFIRESRDEPFLLYLAYTFPHLPLHTSKEFEGHSRAGLFGDVVEEIDWSAGEVLRTLKELGLDRNTIVIFTSDNGPWSSYPREAFLKAYGTHPWDTGSAGPLHGSKFSTYEGGMREPAIVRWPGEIPAGRISAEPASTMDLYPTFIHLAGGEVPADRPVDGRDVFALLSGKVDSLPESPLYYFHGRVLEAVRLGRWKLRLSRHLRPELRKEDPLTPELFDLDADPGEHYDVAAQHPETVTRLRARMAGFAKESGGTLAE
jgi:arylsulfatase A-like enzyme